MKRLFSIVLILTLFVSCNLNVLDQGVLDKGSGSPSESFPESGASFSKEAPRNVAATSAYFQDRINITWSPVEGADFYTVERAEMERLSDDSTVLTWSEVGDSSSASYVDRSASLRKGMYYAYRVTAYQVTREGTLIAGDVSSNAYGTLLAPPDDLSVSKGESYDVITISWKQMPGISRYYIYRSESESSAGMGEYIGVVSQSSNGYQDERDLYGYFEYSVPEDEKGKELYFVVKSAGGIGTMSDSSITRSGYTRVVGGAETPEIESITKGDDARSITIKWYADSSSTEENPISYTVLKSSPGSAEITIFPVYAGQTISPDGNGIYTLVDGDVVDRTEYTYSIIASNEIGKSPAANGVGYLLSPPESIEFAPDMSAKDYHVVAFDDPLGYEEVGQEWKYKVEVVNQDNSVTDIGIVSREELLNYVGKTELSISGSVAFEKEPRFIRIYTVNGSIQSENYLNGIIGGFPDAPQNAMASRNQSSDLPDKNGVFPIFITCEPSGEVPTYGYRITRMDGGFEETSASPSFIDSNVEFAKMYTYSIEALDPFGRSAKEKLGDNSSVSTTNEGYGAITGQKFKDIFESNILKPWEHLDEHPEYNIGESKGSIFGFISAQGPSSLGNASATGKTIKVNGSSVSGKIDYKASVGGRGGLISFTYSRYFSEAGYLFYIDGDFSYQMDVSMSGNGSVSASREFVTGGLFPASVSFANLSVSNYAFSGNYVITQHCSDKDVTNVVSSAR